jgi:hypothetical protein
MFAVKGVTFTTEAPLLSIFIQLPACWTFSLEPLDHWDESSQKLSSLHNISVMIVTGKNRSTQRRMCQNTTLSTAKKDLVFKLIHRSEKPATNSHSSVAVFWVTVQCTTVCLWTSFPFLYILRFCWLGKCNISKEVEAFALMY